jgi:hypothetical protein
MTNFICIFELKAVSSIIFEAVISLPLLTFWKEANMMLT